jgi:ABC-2 type transport system ATP-binding protein
VRGLIKDYPVSRGLAQFLRSPFKAVRKRVLSGLDLTVETGEIVSVLGPNGAGKTTLLKVLATVVRPTAGNASVCGLDVVESEKEARAVVSYAFSEDRSFYWRLTGRQNLEFFAALNDLHGARARRLTDELADRLAIAPYLDQPFSFYSTGIRQRFSLARALLRPTRVLLLDEPTRSVDPAEAREIWSLIRDTLVAQEGMTVLLVTHQAEEAAAVCDRIAVLNNGSIQAQIRPAELRRAMSGLHGLTITLDGFRSAELPRLWGIPGVREVAFNQSNGEQQLEVWLDNGDLPLSQLIAAITASGASIRGLAQSVPVSEIVTRLMRKGIPT